MTKKRARRPPSVRGPRGKVGPPGPKGERGEKGDRGDTGAANDLAERLEAARKVIGELQESVEWLRAESDTQLRRIADLQAQLDITLGEFRHLQEQRVEKLDVRLHKRN
jgi:hypothetical protein